MLNKLLIVLAAAIFSSLTLWIIDSWIKYPLFVFEVLAICVTYLIATEYNLENPLKTVQFGRLSSSLMIDAALIISAVVLLAFNVLFNQGSPLQIALSLIVTSILPGYALLSIFKIEMHFSALEKLVLSFVLSYAFTGLMSFALTFAAENVKATFLLVSFVLLGLLSATKHKRSTGIQTPASFVKKGDLLALSIVIGFYLVSFYFMYPGFALLPGTDLSQHYNLSVVLTRTPDLYIGSTYLFSHLHESAFILLSNASLVNTQMALVFLNLMLPLTFYVMAKPYLEKIDARLPALATLFWVLLTNGFGGYSWVYYAYLKLSYPLLSTLSLLSVAADMTYNGTVYGVFMLWFVPSTMSFVLLMVTIFLLRKTEVPRLKYIGLFSVLIAVMYLTHVTEAVFIIVLIALYALFSRNVSFKFDYALVGSLIGLGIASVVYVILSQITARFFFNLVLLLSLLLPAGLVGSSLLVRRLRLRLKISFSKVKRVTSIFSFKTLAFLIIFAYIILAFSLLAFGNGFSTEQVNDLGVVPWFMYPVMLGATGSLSVIALYCITVNEKAYGSTRFFVALMIFAFAAGVFVSIMNLYFFNVNYWEKRFVWFIKIPGALLAPIAFVLVFDRIKRFFIRREFKMLASVVLVGLIFLSVSTAFLNAEYWNIQADTANIPTATEMSAINAFREILDNDPRAWVATVTGPSLATVAFAAPADNLVLRQLLYEAHSPELALTQLYRSSSYSHPYVYMHTRDWEFLNDLDEGRLLPNFLRSQPIVYQNPEVTIYNVSKLSYPPATSSNVLIVPFESSVAPNYRVAYNMLSYGSYDYNVAYDADHNALGSPTAILSFDPPSMNSPEIQYSQRPLEDYLSYLNSGGRLIVLNTNGVEGFFADQLLASSTSVMSAQRITGLAAMDLPFSALVELVLTKGNVSTLSQYEGADGFAPFILAKNFDNGGELFYFNVYPIVEGLQSGDDKSAINGLLANIFSGMGLERMVASKPFSNINGYMTTANLENTTRVETSTVLFAGNVSVPQLFLDVGNVTYNHTNVSKIQLSDYSKVAIQTYAAFVASGEGFYSRVIVPSDFYIAPLNGPLTLTVVSNNETITYSDVSLVLVQPEYAVELLVRTPTVSAFNAYFTDMHLNNYGKLTTEISGQNIQTTGFTEFAVSLADNYNSISNLTLGSFSQNNALTPRYDYLSTIFTELVLFVVFLPVFTVATYLVNKWLKRAKPRLAEPK